MSRGEAAASVRVWRITKARYARMAFDGEGARLYGGRWNSPGTRVVYASESRALAALALLVHLGSEAALDSYVLVEAIVPAQLIRALAKRELPVDWRSHPAPRSLQAIGDRWVRDGASVVLRVPSAVCPEESNYLIRPDHADFAKFTIGKPVPFDLDRRLLRR